MARVYTDKGAIISDDGKYRYLLWRHWGASDRRCLFVMLNPSTADANDDDPTINRVVGFAEAWGFDGVEIANAFAFRSKHPRDLRFTGDPIGPDNELYVRVAAAKAPLIVVAWGMHGSYSHARMFDWLAGKDLYALRITDRDVPGHPLYIPASEPLKLFRQAA